MLKKFIFIIVILIFSNQILAEEKIKIGVSLPLTAEAAPLGVEFKNVLNLINEKIGNNKFELVFEDDKCQGREATTVAQKFINIDKIKYVLIACSAAILPTARIYSANKIPTIVTLGSASEISNLGKYVFRTSTNDYYGAMKLVDDLAKKHKKVLVLVDENDYSISFYENIAKVSKGKLNVKSEFFKADRLDLKPVILRNKSFKPDAYVILPISVDVNSNITKQIRELGNNQEIYSAYMQYPKGSLKGLVGDGILNLINSSTLEILNSDGKELLKEYNERYGQFQYDLIFVSAIESYRAITQAILNKPDEVVDYLSNATFNGIIGDWKFNKNREVDFWQFEVIEVKE